MNCACTVYTINKENGDNREEIFANIDCEDAEKRKHKIKMKVDTGANGNIILYRIYKKMYSPKQLCKQRNTEQCKKRDNHSMGSKWYQNTAIWIYNFKN